MSRIKNVDSSMLRLKLLATLLFFVVGWSLDGKVNGMPAIHWMYIYQFDEFHSWADIWNFLWDLRTGVSPFWGFVDAASYKIFGHIHLTEYYLYYGAMYLAFVLPIWFIAQKPWQVIGAFGIAIIAILATLSIHKGNAQVYDLYFPVTILLLVKCLDLMRSEKIRPKMRLFLCFLAGLLFSIAELTRPFVLVTVPFFLFGAWRMIRPFPRINFVAVLIPILLLSGSWHLKLIIRNGQLSWSNHTGFNLYQSWYENIDPGKYASFKEEPPLHENWGSANLNTDLHTANSKELSGMIIRQIFRQPGLAFLHVWDRALTFWSPKPVLFDAQFPPNIYRTYRLVVWLLGFSLLLAFLFWSREVFRKGFKYVLDSLAEPELMLMLFLILNITIYIVAEGGEDARFLISVLPMLMCFPGLRNIPRPSKFVSNALLNKLLQK